MFDLLTQSQYIVAQNVIPDQYTWHILAAATNPVSDLQVNVVTMDSFYARYGAPRRSYCINEYINAGEDRVNSANVWHMVRSNLSLFRCQLLTY